MVITAGWLKFLLQTAEFYKFGGVFGGQFFSAVYRRRQKNGRIRNPDICGR